MIIGILLPILFLIVLILAIVWILKQLGVAASKQH